MGAPNHSKELRKDLCLALLVKMLLIALLVWLYQSIRKDIGANEVQDRYPLFAVDHPTTLRHESKE